MLCRIMGFVNKGLVIFTFLASLYGVDALYRGKVDGLENELSLANSRNAILQETNYKSKIDILFTSTSSYNYLVKKNILFNELISKGQGELARSEIAKNLLEIIHFEEDFVETLDESLFDLELFSEYLSQVKKRRATVRYYLQENQKEYPYKSVFSEGQ